MTESIPGGEIHVLRLQPGDVLVLTADYDITWAEADRIRQTLMYKFPDHEVVVLSPGLELSVARRGKAFRR